MRNDVVAPYVPRGYSFFLPRTLKVEELKEEFRNRLMTLEKRLERESKIDVNHSARDLDKTD